MRAIVLGGLAASVIAGAAAAQSIQQWKKMPDGFNIFFNETTGGCYAELQTDQGYVMHIGTEALLFGPGQGHRAGFLAIYAPGDLGEGHSGDQSLVDVLINGKEYQMTAVEVKRDGYTGGYIVGTALGLGKELYNMRQMEILTPGARVKVNVESLDVAATMDEIGTCQRRHGGSKA